jgi:hypothetical protein
MSAPHKIRWWVVIEGERIPRTAAMRGSWGYDATCSCGWQTRTGGAVRSYIAAEVATHRLEVSA